MAQLYSNENFPLPAVEALRRLGHTVVTVRETGKADQAIPDAEVLALARSRNLAVLTLNRRHFVRLHLEQPDHAGIIVCTFDPDVDALAARIHAAIGGQANLRGKLMRINRPSV